MICNYSAAASLQGAELLEKQHHHREAPSRPPAQHKAGVHQPGWDLKVVALQPQEMLLSSELSGQSPGG